MKTARNEDFDIERMDADRWPVAESGYVFLADALERFGRAKFASSWDVAEPPESDEDFEVWEFRSEDIETLEKQMIDEVAEKIAFWARSGVLITAARAKKGGPTQDLSPGLWNFEHWRIRFCRYDISLRDPFSVHQAGTHYLYVRQPTLLRCLLELEPDASIGPLVREVVEACIEMFAGPPPPAMPQGVLIEKIEVWLGQRGFKLQSATKASVSKKTVERAVSWLHKHSDGI
jgi:hypothetical protein